jgi:hypothetical protein
MEEHRLRFLWLTQIVLSSRPHCDSHRLCYQAGHNVTHTDCVIKQGTVWLTQTVLSSRAQCDSHRLCYQAGHNVTRTDCVIKQGTLWLRLCYQSGHIVTQTDPLEITPNLCFNARYLMTVSVAKIAQHGDEWTNMKHRWNDVDNEKYEW